MNYGKTDFEHYIPYDYDIKEYTMFTTRLEDTYDSNKGMYKMDWINSLKLVSYNTENYRNGIYEAYQGLPVEYRQASANKRYIYPSFQNYLPYDGGLYYQMNGGWLIMQLIYNILKVLWKMDYKQEMHKFMRMLLILIIQEKKLE